jgi:hypothetical protein
MTGKLRTDKAVPAFRRGKPLTAEAVNRTIARVRRERDCDNLGSYGGAPKIAHPAKGLRGTIRKPPRND